MNDCAKSEAARQCLALAKIYIEREEFDDAYDRLLEAKQLDTRINIAGGLEAIRRARRPDLRPEAAPAQTSAGPLVTLAGDLTAINVFDAIQVIENARLTGTLLRTIPKLGASTSTKEELLTPKLREPAVSSAFSKSLK